MSLLFCGIFAGLFVVLFVLFIILAVKRKLDKSDKIKYLLGVLLPIFIITAVLAPFAWFDCYADNIPYTLVNDSFYGYVNGDRDNKIEIFKYPVYGLNIPRVAPNHGEINFKVAKRSKFEAYLETVEGYAGVEEDEKGNRYIKFICQDEVWTLTNRPSYPETYYWNCYPTPVNEAAED